MSASWFGKSTVPALHYNRAVLPGVLPPPFNPVDISGLQGWLDANDSSTLNVNEFGTVLSWRNKGDLSGNFDLSGSADIRWGLNTVNNFNVVTFTPNSFMTGTFPLRFQDRSIFIVSRRNYDISGGLFGWFTSDTAGGMETGIVQSGPDYTYILATHPGSSVQLAFTTQINTTGYAELVSITNSATDISGNSMRLNTTGQTLIVNNLADYNTSSFTYYLGNYVNGSPLPNEYDMCEILIYDSVLTPTQQVNVEDYLIRKWGIEDPPIPPAPPIPAMFMDGYAMTNPPLTYTRNTPYDGWTNAALYGINPAISVTCSFPEMLSKVGGMGLTDTPSTLHDENGFTFGFVFVITSAQIRQGPAGFGSVNTLPTDIFTIEVSRSAPDRGDVYWIQNGNIVYSIIDTPIPEILYADFSCYQTGSVNSDVSYVEST